MRRLVPFAAILLAAFSQSPAEQQADKLENAADQSNPRAAAVLDNPADAMRETDPSDPNQQAQNALQAAGSAQAGEVSPRSTRHK